MAIAYLCRIVFDGGVDYHSEMKLQKIAGRDTTYRKNR